MSTRLATGSPRPITLRQRRRVDATLLTAGTAAVSVFALLRQHESPEALAIELLAGAVGGLLIGQNVARRAMFEGRTVSEHIFRTAVWVVTGAVVLTVVETLIGAGAGLAAGLMAGTIAGSQRAYRRLELDA